MTSVEILLQTDFNYQNHYFLQIADLRIDLVLIDMEEQSVFSQVFRIDTYTHVPLNLLMINHQSIE